MERETSLCTERCILFSFFVKNMYRLEVDVDKCLNILGFCFQASRRIRIIFSLLKVFRSFDFKMRIFLLWTTLTSHIGCTALHNKVIPFYEFLNYLSRLTLFFYFNWDCYWRLICQEIVLTSASFCKITFCLVTLILASVTSWFPLVPSAHSPCWLVSA